MDVINKIVKWNLDRGLTTYNAEKDFSILASEVDEYFYNVKNNKLVVDDLCDIIVVAVGTLNKLGYDPTLALEETVKEISSRKGAFNESTGKWQKFVNQDPDTLYKANYDTCKKSTP